MQLKLPVTESKKTAPFITSYMYIATYNAPETDYILILITEAVYILTRGLAILHFYFLFPVSTSIGTVFNFCVN